MTGDSDIPGGVVHDLPGDLEDALRNDPAALATWQDITPLARNEWICWIQSAKKLETRTQAGGLGPVEPQGREAPAVLLAGMSPPLKSPQGVATAAP